MLFNSLAFLIFFPIVVLLYYLLPYKFRWILLLGASYFFYMWWKPEYIVLIVFSTLLDFWAGKKMGQCSTKKERKKYLYLSLLSNLGLLFLFKYLDFFTGNVQYVLDVLHLSYMVPVADLILPMGISFYTFQTMSYSIDVYNGHIKPEKHLGIFALFVSFFPQLVAGPIERASNLLSQFKESHDFNYTNVTNGLKLMVWGLFKKVVIADRIAVMVDYVYSDPTSFGGFALILASVLFAFQIYCDFSGYSDIAIGAAAVIGFKLMENFRRPYFSASIGEFWKRWHISLSTWFRDYVYIPLGGNRVVKWRWHYNLFLTFLISGFWHGANWTFIVWGSLHGLYLIISNLMQDRAGSKKETKPAKFYRVLNIALTFTLVVIAWIFFRASNIIDALYIVSHLFTDFGSDIQAILYNTPLENGLNPRVHNLFLGSAPMTFILAIFFILLMELIHVIQESKGSIRLLISRLPFVFRWSIYTGSIVLIFMFGVFSESQFIYFQF